MGCLICGNEILWPERLACQSCVEKLSGQTKEETAVEWTARARRDVEGEFTEGERAIILHYLWMLEAALERWNRGKDKS